MLPFAISGFFMKPLQLRGSLLFALISCEPLLQFFISKLLLDPGFVPAGSEKEPTPEAVVSVVQGIQELCII